MVVIEYNKEGTPLLMQSTSFFASTVSDREAIKERSKALFPYDDDTRDFIYLDNKRVVAWGEDNMFPAMAIDTVRTTTVLNTGLKFLMRLTMGQGIFPCEVTGYDDDGNEILTPIKDNAIKECISSRMVRRYMEKVLRDYLKVGVGVAQFVPNAKGDIIGLNALNCLHYRFTVPDVDGNQECIVANSWQNAAVGTSRHESPDKKDRPDYWTLPLLMDFDPELHAEVLQFRGKMPRGFAYAVRDAWSNDEIYSEPIWWAAYVLGWIDIAHKIPQFLRTAYKNQTTWKWHVQIPYSFWDKKFPLADFEDDAKKREEKINEYMNSIERNLLGPENAEKPIFTNYAVNEYNGRVEEEWKITPLSNKYNAGQENLVTSSAANSEILFALMVNPNVMGSQMPGGVYAGNQGGSNIREAFLVNIANAWLDRQNILDPLRLFLKMKFNKDVELRFRNTILTTLDSGAGTTRKLS